MATTLAILEQRLQTLYDVSGSQVLSQTEQDQFLNDAYRVLWAMVVAINKDFRVKSMPFTLTSGGTPYVAFPSDFMEVRFVRLNPGGDNEVYLTKFGAKSGSQKYERSYRPEGTNLNIDPFQRAPGSYSLDYIPQPPVLVAPSDTLDVELDQFADFLPYHAATIAIAREEGDASQLQGLLGAIAQRVTRWASDQRSADPDTVEDVRRMSPWVWAPP